MGGIVTPQPIHGFPALLINTGKERLLAVCDLHIGIEEKYRQAGVYIKPVTEKTAERIKTIAIDHDIDRLVIAGDIKHTIPWTTLMESREIPRFFEILSKGVPRFEFIIGNHDARLKELFTKEQKIEWNIRFHTQAFTLGDFAFIHGHKWPPEKIFSKKFIIMAHNHPTIELPQGINGVSLYQQCWIRSTPEPKKIMERYKNVSIPKAQEFIILPSVLKDTRGTPFNSKGVRLLGPILSNGLIDVKNARAFLLDGTQLGKINDLKP